LPQRHRLFSGHGRGAPHQRRRQRPHRRLATAPASSKAGPGWRSCPWGENSLTLPPFLIPGEIPENGLVPLLIYQGGPPCFTQAGKQTGKPLHLLRSCWNVPLYHNCGKLLLWRKLCYYAAEVRVWFLEQEISSTFLGERTSVIVWLDNTRILAIFAVVFLHVTADIVTNVENLNSMQWWTGNIYDALVRWCVPVFVMLSGALSLSEEKNESMSVFYRKRAARLLIPILFWSFIFFAWSLFKGIAKGHPHSLSYFFNRLVSGTPYPHMWFLYMIIGLYFSTPFIKLIIRNTSKNELYLFVAALFYLSATNILYQHFMLDKISHLFTNRFLTFLPYYILGHIIATSVIKINNKYLLLIFTISVLLTASGCFLLGKSNGLHQGVYFYNYLSITVIPMSISIMFLFKKMTTPIIGNLKFNSRFAGIVLGIYLVHPIIIELLKYRGIYAPQYTALISVPLISILVFVISAILAWSIHQTPYLRRTI
jgi:surface polysaccharide O-acyltransferase-like enzyme